MPYITIAIAIITTMLLICTYFWRANPAVYRFDGGGKRIVLLGTQHGNEPGPGLYLQQFAEQLRFTMGINLTIIPVANPGAAAIGIRGMSDMNRRWPHNLLSYMMRDADLVVDFHEGWGFHRCNSASLGQTVWASPFVPAETVQRLDDAIKNLNKKYAGCKAWQRLQTLPDVGPGTLDKWCRGRQIPYVLIEVAGQNNVQTLEARMDQTRILVDHLLPGRSFSSED